MKDELEEYWNSLKNAKNIGKCPRCSAAFEKKSGCSIMTCTVCQYSYCWDCGVKIDDNHNTMGGHWICPYLSVTNCMPIWLSAIAYIFLFAFLPIWWLGCCIYFTGLILCYAEAENYYKMKVQHKKCGAIICMVLLQPFYLIYAALLCMYFVATFFCAVFGFWILGCSKLKMRSAKISREAKQRNAAEKTKIDSDLEKGASEKKLISD